MKPFDLERAKAGDAIHDTVTDVEFYFVGTRYNGEIVIEVYGAQTVACRNQNELRMMPKKRTVWVWLDFYGVAHVVKDLYIDTLREDYPSTKFTKVEVEE